MIQSAQLKRSTNHLRLGAWLSSTPGVCYLRSDSEIRLYFSSVRNQEHPRANGSPGVASCLWLDRGLSNESSYSGKHPRWKETESSTFRSRTWTRGGETRLNPKRFSIVNRFFFFNWNDLNSDSFSPTPCDPFKLEALVLMNPWIIELFPFPFTQKRKT